MLIKTVNMLVSVLQPVKAMTYYLLLLVLTSSYAKAQGLVQWQTSNIQLLRASDYELSDPHGTIVTFEYANQWTYGDFFMFIDRSKFDDGKHNTYSEISPRFSFNKISGKDDSYGVIKDIYIATTIEKGRGNVKAYLIGPGVSMDISGFNFFNANIYNRHNPNLDDDTWQITLAWQYPFSLGSTKWLTEGFADFAGDAGPGYVSNQFVVPRLLIDVSKMMSMKEQSLWIGFEYSAWTNKYGIDGVKERAVQAQIKWVFL